MNKFEQTYLDIIFENNKNNKNKDENETYVKFSSYTFTAPDKKIVLVKEAQDNPEVDHFSKRIAKRNVYKMDDINNIINHALTSLFTKSQYRNELTNENENKGYSFTYAEKYPSIKIKAKFYKNKEKVTDLLNDLSSNPADYICELRTVLYIFHENYKDDIFVESLLIKFGDPDNELNEDGYFKGTTLIE